MDGRTSPGRFLAYLLAEHDMTVKSLCLKSGLAQRDVWSLLCDSKPVTPAIAEKLGRVFYSPGFWSIRQAMWQLWREGVSLPGDRDT
ncbi:XRE family transcriptional regulator [Pantoea sp. JGM49]|jgi:Plasmid maintenance system antidote protein|uniref:helix-turn-helix transcriptional regulator n=1 Tax=unclassified Pantoea TaxID=2630326 RepID=UPI0013523606|nr:MULTISPECIES: XRE family transcriptional regulator [unclassified Pantoea]MBS0881061.1 XRE family transcriptional regulator [Pantoea sp. JGM49]MXP61256.1 XRE family transcriptional regulator [Pantoea sp. Taur]